MLGQPPRGGLLAGLTHHAYHVIDSHIYGFALQQMSLPLQTTGAGRRGSADMLRQIADEYPYLAEHVEHHIVEAWPRRRQSEFEFGLDLILDGLERLRDTA